MFTPVILLRCPLKPEIMHGGAPYKNLSPVTDADGIFRSRGGLFMQY